ncbi:MAG: hypothetical protein A3F12_05355 [Gammaproteobacteria bacterium RIFCSPHIGHO2_12_FULL_38_14]|nr:MAG: hypothetical protein A3F12_05355 [Gammaproteobacteria bacterium RIFCSPHIGHO2_12_FULL_38_14]
MKTLSNKKIILLTAFFSITMVGLLFVFHLQQAPVKTSLSNDAGTIFPSARDVQSFKLIDGTHQAFSNQQFTNHWTLLFFGYTHCGNVCPMTLSLLNRAYQQLQQKYPLLQVVFISLDPERDTPAALLKYTQSFNPRFIGVTGKLQDIRKLQSQFGIFATQDMNNEIVHTSSVLLINPQGQWAGLFKSGLNANELADAFKEAVRA